MIKSLTFTFRLPVTTEIPNTFVDTGYDMEGSSGQSQKCQKHKIKIQNFIRPLFFNNSVDQKLSVFILNEEIGVEDLKERRSRRK